MKQAGARRRWGAGPACCRSLGWAMALVGASGCLFVAPDVEFLSNDELMGSVCEAAGVHLDPLEWRPFHAQVLEDFVLLDFRGETVPGDRATIRRFSLKSTEQRPQGMTDVESLMAVLEERRDGLERIESGTETLDRGRLSWVVYRFDSPIQGDDGAPHAAHGVAAILETVALGEPVVFWLSIDNWGDRPSLSRSSLSPVLAALAE